MRQIPKKLLIHTVKLHKTLSKDRWGKAELDEGTEIRRVRVEPSRKIVRDKNNAEIRLAAVLFYDCVNSQPRDIHFNVDDILSFYGQKYRVLNVEPLFDGENLHHYEVELVKHA